MSGKQIITDFLNFFFIVFYYSYRICVRSFKSLPRTVERLWFSWLDLGGIDWNFMSGKQIFTDFFNFFFIAFYYCYRICVRSFKLLPQTVEMLWFNWVYLSEIPCLVSRSSPIFLIFFSLHSTIATKSAFEVSSRCLRRLKCYDLIGCIWVKFHVW